MTRVNELELESSSELQEALLVPITRQITPAEDPSALHPEIQWQAATMRTDLDRFSDLEISALVQHGYCVGRQVCRENDVAGDETAALPVWQPLSRTTAEPSLAERQLRDRKHTLTVAQRLRKSRSRRTLSTLFSWSDWPSYVWAALLLFVFLTFPFLLLEARRTAIQQGYVLSAISQTSPVYRDVLRFLESDAPPVIPELKAQPVDEIAELDFSGYQVITDDRIYDLRGWRDLSNPMPPLMHARFRFRRTEEAGDHPFLKIQLPSNVPSMRAEFLPESLHSKHVMQELGDDDYLFETQLDFTSVPIGTDTDVIVRQWMPTNMAHQERGFGSFRFTIAAETSIARIWVLLPDNREHTQFRLSRYPIGDPSRAELVEATTTVTLPIGAIANFEIIEPESGFRYECRWEWTND